MVDDPSTDDYICWSPSGKTFFVPNQDTFSTHVLPRFFKHNRFTSFVRQLNMYGFHKVPHLHQGALVLAGEIELWEFMNENFQRDRPDLLQYVVRKNSCAGAGPSAGPNLANTSLHITTLWNTLQSIQRAQSDITRDLHHLSSAQTRLWQEALDNSRRTKRQEETMNKIVKFLGSVFG
ncbi:hypothetical protein K437DRAFT_217062, partial [Tilletiaria anomala UBC 951]